jgi:hypothetical protein
MIAVLKDPPWLAGRGDEVHEAPSWTSFCPSKATGRVPSLIEPLWRGH